jgi:hypothetical protein
MPIPAPARATRRILNSAVLVLIGATTAACSNDHAANDAAAKAAAASGGGIAQIMEITIDGKTLKMRPDEPRDGHVVSASLVGNRNFALSAMDETVNFAFVAAVAPADKGKPFGVGSYQGYECRDHLGCDTQGADNSTRWATLTPYPTGKALDFRETRSAYLAPKLRLTPLTVTITSLEDAYWPGAGPVKRVKGTFKGSLANIGDNGAGQPAEVGPQKQVEGKFDLYTIVR